MSGDELSEVTAFLASAPTPALPDAVEARISAALAAEAAARAGGGGQPGAPAPADDARTLRPAAARARAGRHQRAGGSRRVLRSRPLAVAATVFCLALAGLGYGLSLGGGPPVAPSASPASSASSAAAAAGGTVGQSRAAAAGPEVPASKPASSSSAAGPSGVSFSVTASGTRYQAATLAAQARARLATGPDAVTVPGPSRPGSAPAAASGAPGGALRGCVSHVTGGLSPRLVDRATYQDKPAYIIVGATKVWVVGLGCTAGDPELIVAVPLYP